MKTIKAPPYNFRRNALVALALACALTPATARAATIHGETTASVVWVDAPSAAPAPGEASMTNHFRSFIPPFIVIPAGSSIRFPNQDPFYHSIYSTSKADPFDIGYYGPGPGKLVTFQNPGIVEVHCHIHAFMHATIIVADGPYAVASGGSYSIANVPAGKLELHSWDAKRGERTRTIDVPANGSDVTLDLH